MPNDYSNPCRPSTYSYTSTNILDLNPRYSGVAIKSSIRNLEDLASKMRHAGEYDAVDRIDQMIMSLLEKKIFKKLVAQGRSQRRSSAP